MIALAESRRLFMWTNDGVGEGLGDSLRRHGTRSACRDLLAQDIIADVVGEAGGRKAKRDGGDAEVAGKLLAQPVADRDDGRLRI